MKANASNWDVCLYEERQSDLTGDSSLSLYINYFLNHLQHSSRLFLGTSSNPEVATAKMYLMVSQMRVRISVKQPDWVQIMGTNKRCYINWEILLPLRCCCLFLLLGFCRLV